MESIETSWANEACCIANATELPETFTENMDIAYLSTNSKCLDFFTGVVRGIDDSKLRRLFNESYREDSEKTMQIVFYTFACRDGKDERNIGKKLIKLLWEKNEPLHLTEWIPEHGRWDYLFPLINSSNNNVSNSALKIFSNGLWKNYNEMKKNKKMRKLNFSSKWAPREKSKTNKHIAQKLTKYLFPYEWEKDKSWAKKKYRNLYKDACKEGGLNVPEIKMAASETISDYSKVPSKCMMNHSGYIKKGKNKGKFRAFPRNDPIGWAQYEDDLKNKKAKVNTMGGKASIVQINSYLDHYINTSGRHMGNYVSISPKLPELNQVVESALDDIFEKAKARKEKSNIAFDWLVVPDVSESMITKINNVDALPFKVAISLALLLSSLNNTPAYQNLVMAFSADPKLVKIKGDSWRDKLHYLMTQLLSMIGYNTDFDKLVDMVIDISRKHKCKPAKLLLVSDMQTDRMDHSHKSKKNKMTFLERTKYKYDKLYRDMGWQMDDFQMIAMNVNGIYQNHPVKKSEPGVAYISGVNQMVVEDILLQGKITNPYESMKKVLKKFEHLSLDKSKMNKSNLPW